MITVKRAHNIQVFPHRNTARKECNYHSQLTIFNILNPSGNFTYHRFNIKKFYVVPTLRLCVLYGSQNKQQLLPYKTLRDWFL
jgi:hypothetical protein